MLSKNQWTEELPHNDNETGDSDAFAKFSHPYVPPANFYSSDISIFSESKVLAYIHHSEQIPSNHSTEVVVPPPDAVI